MTCWQRRLATSWGIKSYEGCKDWFFSYVWESNKEDLIKNQMMRKQWWKLFCGQGLVQRRLTQRGHWFKRNCRNKCQQWRAKSCLDFFRLITMQEVNVTSFIKKQLISLQQIFGYGLYLEKIQNIEFRFALELVVRLWIVKSFLENVYNYAVYKVIYSLEVSHNVSIRYEGVFYAFSKYVCVCGVCYIYRIC